MNCGDTKVAASQVAVELRAGGLAPGMLDVLSLAELQRLGVPHTDDDLKYRYSLEHGRYGRSQRLNHTGDRPSVCSNL